MMSIVLRRIHMYLALFLTPWILMYGLSTMAMNHHQSLRALYGGGAPAFVPDRAEPYTRIFDAEFTKQQMARQILVDLDLDGRFRVNGDPARRLTILRIDPVSPTRVIYLPQKQQITVEIQQLRTPNMLARLHMRQGFRSDYAVDDAWAVSVDLVIGAMLFWVGSGLWLWWELKVTRRLGGLAMLAGVGLFALFLLTI
ncbi:MAG: hypothetical protein HOM68_24130 [Gemmatimonadetes bacterium]|nr:hypothetical protein [Gemmatimonadota bacterium]MBT4610876.1 hypothetical protein [Gemmatimonadota bacterium]MBT5059656.1 hypothetical protein [Gemmatimonadota bacterium]MBT5587570.1 hypothetical protein [Gemmatimonadota bacterium]MBT7597056.1 hypothetical protein [Gemmatimonadota bacterium]